jgi:hypothetical protein
VSKLYPDRFVATHAKGLVVFIGPVFSAAQAALLKGNAQTPYKMLLRVCQHALKGDWTIKKEGSVFRLILSDERDLKQLRNLGLEISERRDTRPRNRLLGYQCIYEMQNYENFAKVLGQHR